MNKYKYRYGTTQRVWHDTGGRGRETRYGYRGYRCIAIRAHSVVTIVSVLPLTTLHSHDDMTRSLPVATW